MSKYNNAPDLDLYNTTGMYYISDVKKAKDCYIAGDYLNPADGDAFFEEYAPGNAFKGPLYPFERSNDYENLLRIIRKEDPDKYLIIHKGTPFYFMGWINFYLKQYEKAVYYMDCAISEDIRKTKFKNPALQNDEVVDNALQWPAGQFFKLAHQSGTAQIIVDELSNYCQHELIRFNRETGTAISLKAFIDNFISILLKNEKSRSIATAIYSFILEYHEIRQMIVLRSSLGGSIEPILTYLFKGGLIFESLLKYLYPTKDDGTIAKTIGHIAHTNAFKTDYISSVDTTATSIKDIIKEIQDSSLKTSFNTTARIRNTTGHNLQWEDEFDDVLNFEKLHNQIINSILYICDKSFIKP